MKFAINLLALLAIFVQCDREDTPAPTALPAPMEVADPPSESISSVNGTFTGFAHNLSGEVALYTENDGKRSMFFQSYSMAAGPDVYVLLSKANNYSSANTIQIASLKGGYQNSSLSFEIDQHIDLGTYKFVLVYCIEYNSLFGFAELK